MIDYLFKLSRKKLSSNLYRTLQCGIGRVKNMEKLERYSNIFLQYKKPGYCFQDKIVLEVGSGNQIFTALFFLSSGAKKVLLVDPKITVSGETIKSSVNEWNAFSHKSGLSISEEKVKDLLFAFPDMNNIPDKYNSLIDNAFSHQVLEHFSNLSVFFQNTSRLISANGFSDNIVDLSDHSYHVFDKYKATRFISRKRALFHLRYSDETFGKINDNRIYMNRLLLPVYFELAKKHSLEPKLLDKSMFTTTKIHNDVLSKFQSRNPAEIYITNFRILLKKMRQ